MTEKGILNLALFCLAAAGGMAGFKPVQAARAAEGSLDYSVYLPMALKEHPQTPLPEVDGWLAYLNSRRALGGLPLLSENSSWSNGCWDHSRYMVKNDVITHDEDESMEWYTSAGDAAGNSSDVMVSSSMNTSDEFAIDLWLTGPFHGLGILDPHLAVTGFESFREAGGTWAMGACLDVIRGRGALPAGVTFPIYWPENGSSMPYTAYPGSEYPDPIQGCGYTAPSGPPVYLMLGSGGLSPMVTAHSFSQGGTSLEHCVYTETTYDFPGDTSGQSLGRAILNSRDAVILIPRNPLSPEMVYTVSITADSSTYTWSFTAISSAVPDLLEADFRMR